MEKVLSRKYLLVQRPEDRQWNLMMEVQDKTKSRQLTEVQGTDLMNEVTSTTVSFLVQRGLITLGEFR